MSVTPSTAQSGTTALVWDWPLRAFHWALTVAIGASFATHYLGIEWFEWHRRAGFAVLILVGFRLAWGVVGPRYARFASFVRGPGAVFDYLRGTRPFPPVVGCRRRRAIASRRCMG